MQGYRFPAQTHVVVADREARRLSANLPGCRIHGMAAQFIGGQNIACDKAVGRLFEPSVARAFEAGLRKNHRLLSRGFSVKNPVGGTERQGDKLKPPDL